MAKATVARQSIVQQLHDLLIGLLRDEQYTAGSSLPSEFELAERFIVSRATIREALKGLVQEGLLDCRHGKGYFVLSREAVIHKPITQWQSVTDLMADMGYTVANRVLRAREESPTPQVRRALQLNEGQTVVQLEIFSRVPIFLDCCMSKIGQARSSTCSTNAGRRISSAVGPEYVP